MAHVVVTVSFFFIALLSPLESKASSCCGGSPTSFLVPVNLEKWNLNISESYINGVGRAFKNSQDVVKWRTTSRDIHALDLSGSYLFTERLSLSAHGGFHFSNYSNANSLNLHDETAKDSLLSLNYEALPEYTYHPIRPKIFTSLLLNLPTGQSLFEDDTLPEGANVTGHSLWGLGAGLTVYKAWFPLILNQQFKFLQLFGDQLGGQELSSYYDFSSSTRLTYSLKQNWKVFTNLSWAYISSRQVNSIILQNVNSSLEALSTQSTTLGLGFSYNINEYLNLSASYSDQTLLGQPRNVVLNRTFNFNINAILN